MKRIIAVVVGIVLGVGSVTSAQSNPIFVQLGQAKGALYKPDRGPAPRVAILIAHRAGNFMNHPGTRELSRRGFMVLGMNTRFENNEANVIFEDIALDVRASVEFLKRQPGITKIVLFAHSGGGATMTFYQAVAEKGPAASQGPGKIVQGDTQAMTGFPPADGLVLVDAHPGVSIGLLRGLDPMLVDENEPLKLDSSLDPRRPEVGFNPNGASKYTDEFKQKYHRAQSDRMNRLIDKAQTTSKQMAAGEHLYRDNDVFIVYRAGGGGLRARDPGIYDSTTQPRRLLKNDGSITTEVIATVRPPTTGAAPAAQPGLPFSSLRQSTVRSFLSTVAVRSTNSIDGIDWASTNNSVPNNLRNITVPVLVTAMGAHTFIRDNEVHFEMSASADKEFIVIDGATHNMEPFQPPGGAADRYSNVTKNFYDHVAKWINARF